MEFTEEQLKFIQKNKPEFNLKPVPSLDSIIVEFLQRYEVYVKPASSSRRSAGDVGSGAVAGAITGMAGADVGGDAFIIRGQQKQTAIQEWTQWKQWALDHKDFETFRSEKIDLPKTYNLKILESLKDPKVQKELEPLIKKFVELEKKEDKYRKTALGIILGISGFTFFMLFAIPSIIDVIEKDKFKEDNSWMKKPLKKEFYSEYYENYCKNEDPTKITQPYFKRYYKTYCID